MINIWITEWITCIWHENDGGFLIINSNICHGQFWQKEVFFRHPVCCGLVSKQLLYFAGHFFRHHVKRQWLMTPKSRFKVCETWLARSSEEVFIKICPNIYQNLLKHKYITHVPSYWAIKIIFLAITWVKV